MKLTVVIRKDPEEKHVYNASVPALPGCHSWGRSRAEALKRPKEAMLVYIESIASAARTGSTFGRMDGES